MRNRTFILFLISCIIVLFTKCASTGFLMAKPRVTLFGQVYPKKGVNDSIDVFVTNKPTKNYIEFAKITCNDTNDNWCFSQILKKAKEIGADGIIIIGKSSSSGVAVPIGNIMYVDSKGYGMTAIAIKYP